MAFNLKMPVYKMVKMPYDELLRWFAYFDIRPIDWRDDERTFRLMQVQGVDKKTKPWDVFPSLRAIHNPPAATETNLKSLKGSALFSMMLGAKGGEKLENDL